MTGVTRHRRHQRPGRHHRFLVSYDDDEDAVIREAAARAGLTPTGYIAAAALASAAGTRPPMHSETRDALAELTAASTLLRRFTSLVNQAVTRYHATGVAPPELEAAVGRAMSVVDRVDRAADRTSARLP